MYANLTALFFEEPSTYVQNTESYMIPLNKERVPF